MNRVWAIALLAGSIFFACTHEPKPLEYRPTSQGVLDRGAKLAHGLSACGACHGAQPLPSSPLTGGMVLRDSFGDVTAPNLTGIDWSLENIVRAIRISGRPDGERFSPEFHSGYQWLSNDDAYAIASYIKSLRRSGSSTAQRAIDSVDRLTKGFHVRFPNDPGFVPPIPSRFRAEYGAYLVDRVAQCGVCHTTAETFFDSPIYLGGGSFTRAGETHDAPAIHKQALSDWTPEQLKRFLTSGVSRDGVQSKTCPTPFYARATSEELSSMVAYLLGR